jgi:hypothetical protein
VGHLHAFVFCCPLAESSEVLGSGFFLRVKLIFWFGFLVSLKVFCHSVKVTPALSTVFRAHTAAIFRLCAYTLEYRGELLDDVSFPISPLSLNP